MDEKALKELLKDTLKEEFLRELDLTAFFTQNYLTIAQAVEFCAANGVDLGKRAALNVHYAIKTGKIEAIPVGDTGKTRVLLITRKSLETWINEKKGK